MQVFTYRVMASVSFTIVSSICVCNNRNIKRGKEKTGVISSDSFQSNIILPLPEYNQSPKLKHKARLSLETLLVLSLNAGPKS